MKTLLIFLLGGVCGQQLPYPLMMPYNNGSYDSYWDGPQGQKGFWGQLPPQKNNVFNSDWDANGFKQMYNLNSVAPFQQDRMTGYDSMVPYYTPMQNSQQVFYPNLRTYGSDGQINPHNQDLNSRSYKKIYEDYYDFYSKNINKLKSLYAKLKPIGDLNDQDEQEKKYPDSFNYKQYYDNFDEKYTLNGPGLPQLIHKGNGRGRYLKQLNLNFDKIKKIVQDYERNNSQLKGLDQEEKSIKKQIRMIKQKLNKDKIVKKQFQKMFKDLKKSNKIKHHKIQKVVV